MMALRAARACLIAIAMVLSASRAGRAQAAGAPDVSENRLKVRSLLPADARIVALSSLLIEADDGPPRLVDVTQRGMIAGATDENTCGVAEGASVVLEIQSYNPRSAAGKGLFDITVANDIPHKSAMAMLNALASAEPTLYAARDPAHVGPPPEIRWVAVEWGKLGIVELSYPKGCDGDGGATQRVTRLHGYSGSGMTRVAVTITLPGANAARAEQMARELMAKATAVDWSRYFVARAGR